MQDSANSGTDWEFRVVESSSGNSGTLHLGLIHAGMPELDNREIYNEQWHRIVEETRGFDWRFSRNRLNLLPGKQSGQASPSLLKVNDRPVNIELFDFHLPPELIAQTPVEPRDQSRLMVLDRRSGTLSHHLFCDLPKFLNTNDLIVRNNTRVLPARLIGTRDRTGGQWECLFLNLDPDGCWNVITQTRGKPHPGETVTVGQGLKLRLVEKLDRGAWRVKPANQDSGQTFQELLELHGHIPLPHYIRAGQDQPEDRAWYQTVFANEAGSVAAPTAGLHFTPRLIDELQSSGVSFTDVTLHVGIGTFQPIRVENIEEHVLHAEVAEVTEDTKKSVELAKSRGGRVIAVGTTSTRTLEASARSGKVQPFRHETALYIKPGFQFNVLDGLITNFHLPKSSLIVLVSAFAGHEFVMEAYREAVREGYRFYSYGDAMLIL